MQSELEKYLHAHIPLSKAMQVSVVSVEEDNVVLSAPLAPNINHRDTVFGGSASALGILAAWSLLHTRMRRLNMDSRLVIQRNTVEYELPIMSEFTARATLDQPSKWEHFLRVLSRKGKARVAVTSVLECAGNRVGIINGEFVAINAVSV